MVLGKWLGHLYNEDMERSVSLQQRLIDASPEKFAMILSVYAYYVMQDAERGICVSSRALKSAKWILSQTGEELAEVKRRWDAENCLD